MRKIYRLLLFGLAFFMNNALQAQENMTLYNMELLQARSTLNPALMNHGRVNVNLPGVSNTCFSYGNSAFKYSDLVKRSDDDSLFLDIGNMISKMKSSNRINLAVETDLLAFGFRVKKSYIGLNATEKIHAMFSYTRELMDFIYKGNGALLDQQVNLNFGLDLIHYREYGFTFSHNLNNRLTIGTKVKYLYGMENVHNSGSGLSLYTDPQNFAITAQSNIRINTSGLNQVNEQVSNDLTGYAFRKQNNGFGVDLGFNYKLNKRVTISGSVIDLGFINWRSDVSSYVSTNPDAEFTYNGIDINQYSTDSTTYQDALQDAVDSLFSKLHIDTLHESYKTNLPTRIYCGGNYYLNERNFAAVLISGQYYNKKMHPAATVSFNSMVVKGLNLSISYTMVNNTYNNLGFGFAFNDYDVQLFAVTDNIIGVIFPTRAQQISLRAGINLKFGNITERKNKPVSPPKAEPVAP